MFARQWAQEEEERKKHNHMGKKRIVKSEEKTASTDAGAKKTSLVKKKLERGVLHVQSTYNNTMLTFADEGGNAVFFSSSGALGFKGAKKGTPFAAAKVGEMLGEKAKAIGVKEVTVVVKGVGAGRESAIRGFISKGIGLLKIKDITPVPHNGPRPPKPRRV